MKALGCVLLLAACGPSVRSTGGSDSPLPDAAPSSHDAVLPPTGDAAPDSFVVYAHGDHVLYSIDLATQALTTVGSFHAPQVMVGTQMKEDVITDLAVAPDGTIYTISETALYTAATGDGHVTRVGSLATCGQKAVALTTTSDGRLWTGDYAGALCQIDVSVTPPIVRPPVHMTGSFALAGDMVGVDSGTVYGTAILTTDAANTGSQMNNLLVRIDVATGAVTQIGPSGFPRLYGTAFQQGHVFGFTHDGTGRVVEIDPTSGAGTVFGTFMDPTTGKGISFAGAGVSSLILE